MLELPPGFALLTGLVAGWLGIAYGRRLHRRGFQLTGSVRVRECPLIPLCILLFVATHVLTAALIRDPAIWWSVPVSVEYYLTPTMWVLKGLFATFAITSIVVVAFCERYRWRVLLLLFSIGVLVTIDTLTRLSVQPYLGEVTNRIDRGVVMQSNPSTCAAASAANIARHFGIDVNEYDMVKRLNTTWAGTSPSQLVYGFRGIGLDAQKVFRPELDLAQVHTPAILLVKIGGEPDAHAVAYMGQAGDQFEIWDPSAGRAMFSLEDVRKRWQGRAIEVRRNSTPSP